MLPRMRSIASTRVTPRTGSPLMWVKKSPGSTPARKAGESSIGLRTFTKPFSTAISTPTPPNSPLFCALFSAYLSGFRYLECGSSEVSRPPIAASTSLSAST